MTVSIDVVAVVVALAVGVVLYYAVKRLVRHLERVHDLERELIAMRRQSEERKQDIIRIVQWMEHEEIEIPQVLLDEICDTAIFLRRTI